MSVSKTKTIVLVHGLWETAFYLRILGHRLKKSGYNVQYFSYSGVSCELTANVESLFKLLETLKTEDIYLVGHSLGGLVVLGLLAKYSALNVRCSVIFGTPVNGSSVAKAFGKSYLGSRMMGSSYAALCNGARLLSDQKVGVIAGIGGKGLGQFFAKLQKPHDGVVSVSETVLPNAVDSACLTSSHFTMLLSKSLADEIISFFKTEKFIS